ncbi:MAG: hypothetical protein HW421_1653 [Ignavibacteria bacterium]|nr:hypothetical protein [Ignavibacteria bacterium]
MEIGEILYVTDRSEWRQWLQEHCSDSHDIWLVYYNKKSGKPRIPYNDAVEEALCFGWIDSIIKSLDSACAVQRFSPRKKNSKLSEANKERIRRLVREGKMTDYGLKAVVHHLPEGFLNNNNEEPQFEFSIPEDILTELQANPDVLLNFEKFSDSYKRVRIGWIDGARIRPDEFRKRLNYFIKMTSKNKMYGMIK